MTKSDNKETFFYGVIIIIILFGILILSNPVVYDSSNPKDESGNLKISLHDGYGNQLKSLKGSLDIHDSDVHINIINRHFTDYDTATENPLTQINSTNTVILVASTTGFTVGDDILILNEDGDQLEHHFEITNIVIDTSITVDRPIDYNYSILSTLEVVELDMTVIGTLSNPIIYEVIPPKNKTWHITRILISMTDQSAMDDSLFGGISPLTNGVVLRENKDNIRTITNWKSNSDMIEDMFDISYSSKAPAGYFGLAGRFTFDKAKAIVRLNGSNNETLQILIQDDLTDLDTFRIKAQGHLEES